MKIAIISMIREPWGGSEELWYDMAKTALLKGHKIIHLSFDATENHPKIIELIKSGMQEYKRPGFKSNSNNELKRFVDKCYYFLKKQINPSLVEIFAQRPDIVLYNGTCYSIAEENKLMQLIKKYSGKFFIIGHLNNEADSGLSKTQVKKVISAYSLAQKVFFVSNKSRFTAEQHLGIPIRNAAIIRNPVNMKDTGTIPYPVSSMPQMALVGNLVVAHKGQDIVLHILSKPEWMKQAWHLNIYGKGIDEQLLKDFVLKNNMSHKVTFHGRVNDVRSIWKINHLLLMPSLMEGMPLALVEAMLCGRASVITDVGGNAEWVTDLQHGFIAKKATANDFEAALITAFHHKEKWEMIGAEAHKRAIALYDKNAGNTLLQLIINN
jgi:L-malate glycosyltransferase